MEDLDDLGRTTTTFVVVLLILSAVGILWAVSCSWMSGRKKRQRVANNADVDGLVLQMANPVNRAKGKPPDRYSVSDQITIPSIDDLGQSLQVPTILVTPPSPQDLVGDVTSIRSDSSIGSAEDLLSHENSEVMEMFELVDEAGVGLGRRTYIRDSMRNSLVELGSTPPLDSEDKSVVQRSSSFTYETIPIRRSNGAAPRDVKTGSYAHGDSSDTISVISMDGETIDGAKDDDDSNDEEEKDAFFARGSSRLRSLEPGSKNSSIVRVTSVT